ncbi:hypothetical protein FRC11_003932 [Ceratobasidium sp. 423]|nr:hypothetical protein FRC11_003932 [Ceratobasidium sp. 423]
MSSDSHISGSQDDEHSVHEFTRSPIDIDSSPVGSPVSTSDVDEHSAIDNRIAAEIKRFNDAVCKIEETAASDPALARAFIALLKELYPEDAMDLDACLAAELTDIPVRAITSREAEVEKYKKALRDIHSGRGTSN